MEHNFSKTITKSGVPLLWTLRIDADGNAIPCYAKKLRIPIVGLPKDKSYKNFLTALYNLGRSPESKVIKF